MFAPLITKLANPSYVEGRFPGQFKLAQVTPLLKKVGLDTTDPANYRPMSNIKTISKIIERLVLARLLPHIAATGNFNPLQSAYRKHHSTETALLKILDDLNKVVNSGKSSKNSGGAGWPRPLSGLRHHRARYLAGSVEDGIRGFGGGAGMDRNLPAREESISDGEGGTFHALGVRLRRTAGFRARPVPLLHLRLANRRHHHRARRIIPPVRR